LQIITCLLLYLHLKHLYDVFYWCHHLKMLLGNGQMAIRMIQKSLNKYEELKYMNNELHTFYLDVVTTQIAELN
jgi:hypothetical protein